MIKDFKVLIKHIDKMFNDINTDIQAALLEAQDVCIIANLWSEVTRSFLGGTTHFLDDDLKTVS